MHAGVETVEVRDGPVTYLVTDGAATVTYWIIT